MRKHRGFGLTSPHSPKRLWLPFKVNYLIVARLTTTEQQTTGSVPTNATTTTLIATNTEEGLDFLHPSLHVHTSITIGLFTF